MVRYADGPNTHAEITIAASPEQVWPLVSDINASAAFSPEFQRAEWLDDGPALGARFRGHNRHEAVGEWSVPCTVTGFEAGRVFEWTVGDVNDKVARWRFDVQPVEDGSHVRYSAEIGPGRSGLTPMIERMPEHEEEIVASRLVELNANMTRTLEGFKGLAEAGGSQP